MTAPLYQDPTASAGARVEDLLARMTLEEKTGQLFHPYSELPTETVSPEAALQRAQDLIDGKLISHFVIANGDDPAEIARWVTQLQEIAAGTRLGIPVTFSMDPRNGYTSSPYTGQAIASASRWPEHIGLGAVDDVELIRTYGEIVRRELLSMGVRSYLGPMADIFSEPRWMRGFGTFGEDVETVTRLTAEFIRAMRGGDQLSSESVTCVVKHFPGAGPQRGGNDAIDERYPDQIYPGGEQALHLRPFEAAFEAGASQVMLYYGMPVGTEWEEIGFAFNRSVVRDLLRGRYGFDGIVTTDWNVISSEPIGGRPFGPIAHGATDLTAGQRLQIALEVGVDQFGGDTTTEEVCELVRSGRVSLDRLDDSVRRILREKFRLGLFEAANPDPDEAARVCGDPWAREQGLNAQARSLALLKQDCALPLPEGTRVYAEGVDLTGTEHPFTVVESPEDADAIVVRLESPWEHDPDSRLGDFLHGGSLDFTAEVVDHVRGLADAAPTIAIVYLERPAVLTPLLDSTAALIVDFGANDQVVLDALRGAAPITGKLPFDLPRSMAAVEASREDVPFDTADPLFRATPDRRHPAAD